MKKQAIFFLVFFLPLAAFGSWTWTTTNGLNDIISPAWADETRNAIKQLAADIYTTPSNSGTGAGILSSPIQTSGLVTDGIATSASTVGVAVTLSSVASFTSISQYGVMASFQGDTNGTGGDIYFSKATGTVTIYNSGIGTGTPIWYRVYRVVN